MQPNLLDIQPKFDGPSLTEADTPDLSQDLAKVRRYLLQCKEWKTLPEIHQATGVPLISVGSRVRDLRKRKFGSYDVQRRARVGFKRLNEYRIAQGEE